MDNNKKGFAEVIIILVVLVLGAVGYFYIAKGGFETQVIKTDQSEGIEKNSDNNTPTVTPTLFEFQEMTIPGLRARNYESKLGKLHELNSTPEYTVYTTSYDSDGFKVNGYLTVPKGDMPNGGWPAVVFVHGYIPPTEYVTTKNYVSYVAPIAREGFVVFKIDLRGHGNSEGEPGGAYYSDDYVVDTLNAYSALQQFNKVNADRVGLWGHSMAGNVVFRSLVAAMNIPASVIWAGAVYTYEDLQQFRIEDNSYRPPPPDSQRVKDRQRLRELYGDFDPDSEFWKQVVPTNYLDNVRGALQINHAANDGVVNIGYSRNLMGILDSTSIKHELKEYSSGGHNITGPSFNEAMQNTVEFYKENL